MRWLWSTFACWITSSSATTAACPSPSAACSEWCRVWVLGPREPTPGTTSPPDSTGLATKVARPRAGWYKDRPLDGRKTSRPVVNLLILWNFYEPRLRSYGQERCCRQSRFPRQQQEAPSLPAEPAHPALLDRSRAPLGVPACFHAWPAHH